MSEAFEIGVTLALNDGVSDGIARARSEMAAFEKVLMTGGVSVSQLRKAAAGAVAPPQRQAEVRRAEPKPADAGSDAMSSQPAVEERVRPVTRREVDVQRRAPHVGDDTNGRGPVSAARPDEAKPALHVAPVIDGSAPPDGLPVPQPAPPPALRAAVLPQSPVSVAYTVSRPKPANQEVYDPRQRSNDTATPFVGTPVPRHLDGDFAAKPPQQTSLADDGSAMVAPLKWVGVGQPTSAVIAPMKLDSSATQEPGDVGGHQRFGDAGEAQRATPAAPNATDTRPAIGSASTPQTVQAAGQGPREGDVFLDGVLVGRWMSRFLAREAGRASAGPTGFDARRGRLLPGPTVGN